MSVLLSLMPLFINRIGGPQLIILALIILLLFGGKKIPELMRGLGKGVKAFRQGLKEELEEANVSDEKEDNQV